MDHDDLMHMCVEIVGGVAKEKSRHCQGEEASALWDEVVADIAKIKARNPDAIIDTASEIA